MIETKREAERAVLVIFAKKGDSAIKINESLEELKLLAGTSGAEVIKTFYQAGTASDPRFMIGKGKADEIAEYAEDKEISLVIFENELSYTQFRNLEQKIKCKILDKSNLILDIFANNARTAQSKLQVELAQLEYLLPRLTRQWTHLSKQYGGIGTKGPGETQIETDRRLIKKRISVLKEKLEKIDRQRRTQALERKNYLRLSLVGYTNAGKSTLLNLLTDANVYVEDKLFATLDTSTRMLKLSNAKAKEIVSRFPKKVLISDTVGFIKNLPHNLIESFKSTLSEVVESDMLLHVIDISNPNHEEQMSVVKDTLDEIGAGSRRIINIFNKVDRLNDFDLLSHIKEEHKDSVFMSAKKGLNVEYLLNKIKEKLSEGYEKKTIKLKKEDYKLLNKIYELAEVAEVKYLKTCIKLKIKGTKENTEYIEKLIYANIKL